LDVSGGGTSCALARAAKSNNARQVRIADELADIAHLTA
jgi:hypothetical protein